VFFLQVSRSISFKFLVVFFKFHVFFARFRETSGAYDFAILKKGNDIFLNIQRLRTSTSQSLIHNNFALMNSSHSQYTLLSTCRLYKWTLYGGSGIILNIFIRVSKGRTNFRVFLTIESSNIYFYLRVRV
jgi:hypothetical protein